MKIYIAGPYDGPDVITIIGNIRRGIDSAADLMRKGNEVYCPFLDFLIGLMPGEQIDKKLYQLNSLSFIEWCDRVVLLPGWEKSNGVRRELDLAKKLGKEIQEIEVTG
jgi:hypothetical protein